MTNPIKTVSGIIGIGKNVEKQPNNCDICDAKNCIYRNKLQGERTVNEKKKEKMGKGSEEKKETVETFTV